MQKASSQICESNSKNMEAMELLARKLDLMEHRISKVMSSGSQGLPSRLASIDVGIDAIWKSLRVLHDKIEIIAQKVETLSKSELVPILEPQGVVPPPCPEMNCTLNTEVISSDDEPDWFNSLIHTQDVSDFPDITCSETPFLFQNLLNDPASPSNGFTDFQEWANHDMLTRNSLQHTSRTQGPSGGMDTS